MGSGRSFYYYGYGSWDERKNFFSWNPLRETNKINKLHLYNIFQQKKNELRGYDAFGSYDFAKNVLFVKHFYVFIEQTELFTYRERKSPGIFISKSKDLVTIFFLTFSIFDPFF